MNEDSTQRFTDRVDAYQRARPTYPDAIVAHLARVAGLAADATIVDLGVGTGLSAEPFLRAGHTVIGVEPNDAMRAAGDAFLAEHVQRGRYRSVKGTAEQTSLPDACAALAIAGQAFHWFDAARARDEVLRVLHRGGWAALIWNDRETQGSEFLAGYEAILVEYGNDYVNIRHRHVGTDSIPTFFGGHSPQVAQFRHRKRYDWDTLVAQVGSASYMPRAGDPIYPTLMAALRKLFDATAQAGAVEMHYATRVHAAPMAA